MKNKIEQLARRAVPKTRARAGVVILVASAVGVAAASIPDSSGLVHGCYKATAATNGTHALTIIDAAKTSACPSGYKSLNWNVNGPNAWLENTSPSNSSSLGVCELAFGSATDQVQAGLLGPASTPLNNQTLSMTVAATVTSSTSATLSCEAVGNTGETFAETASMTATQAGSLNP